MTRDEILVIIGFFFMTFGGTATIILMRRFDKHRKDEQESIKIIKEDLRVLQKKLQHRSRKLTEDQPPQTRLPVKDERK